ARERQTENERVDLGRWDRQPCRDVSPADSLLSQQVQCLLEQLRDFSGLFLGLTLPVASLGNLHAKLLVVPLANEAEVMQSTRKSSDRNPPTLLVRDQVGHRWQSGRACDHVTLRHQESRGEGRRLALNLASCYSTVTMHHEVGQLKIGRASCRERM